MSGAPDAGPEASDWAGMAASLIQAGPIAERFVRAGSEEFAALLRADTLPATLTVFADARDALLAAAEFFGAAETRVLMAMRAETGASGAGEGGR